MVEALATISFGKQMQVFHFLRNVYHLSCSLLLPASERHVTGPVSKVLCPVNGSPVRPGWSLLHRLLLPRCPAQHIGNQPAYPEGSAAQFRRCSHRNLPVTLASLHFPWLRVPCY